MSPTYSVIIQNQKTMKEFSKYQPLFSEALNNDRIGVCKWVESGTTIDTAIPELSQLTDDKEEWRAVIVRFEDDMAMSNYEADKRNPYDFVVNQNTENEIFENPVPLVRLTHMLGGIPAPEMEFAYVQEINEKSKKLQMVYKPVVNEKKNQAYSDLTSKYQFDGKLPSSIVIISVREKLSADRSVNDAWISHNEANSSEFWKRNHYPSSCRFLVYDFEKSGPVQKEADKFGFWLSTLLVSINEIDASTLQAYKLFKLNTVIDKKLMSKEFSETMGRLKIARHRVEEEIRQDISKQMLQSNTLPDYKMEVSVDVKTPNKPECTVNKDGFSLFSDGITTDLINWECHKDDVENNLADAIIAAERELNQTASRVKRYCTFSENEVLALDKYQEEDLERETRDLCDLAMSLQGDLPDKTKVVDDYTRTAANNVRKYLRGRVLTRHAIASFVIILLLSIASNIPAIVQYMAKGVGTITSIVGVIAIETLIISLMAIIVAFIQKSELNELIEEYNTLIKAKFNSLIYDASDYSHYMSVIASHSRGRSYLNMAARKKRKVELSQYSKYTHLSAINVFMADLNNWAIAHHLDVDFNNSYAEGEVYMNTSVLPSKNPMYTFNCEKEYDVSINNSGLTIKSPFVFVKKVEIKREGIYDDKRS